MHCHTKEGSIDAKLPIKEYIQLLKERGFDGMLISDHDSYNGYEHYLAHKDEMPKDFTVIKGIEYDTLNGGHILVIMPEGVHLKILEHRGMRVERLIHIVHSYGGILGPAHPYGEPFLSIFSTGVFKYSNKIAEKFDFIEGFNSAEDEVSNAKAERIGKRYHKPITAGSDSHRADSVGMAYTEFAADIKNADDLISYIKECREIAYGGEHYRGTLKQKIGNINKFFVLTFYPYNKAESFLHVGYRIKQLNRIKRELGDPFTSGELVVKERIRFFKKQRRRVISYSRRMRTAG